MESARARKLTTHLVAIGLLLGGACFLVGTVLSFVRPPADDASLLPLAKLPSALVAGDPVAWLSLGALWLILSPSLRLVGMLLTFHSEGDRRAIGSGLVVLAILLVHLFVYPMFQ